MLQVKYFASQEKRLDQLVTHAFITVVTTMMNNTTQEDNTKQRRINTLYRHLYPQTLEQNISESLLRQGYVNAMNNPFNNDTNPSFDSNKLAELMEFKNPKHTTVYDKVTKAMMERSDLFRHNYFDQSRQEFLISTRKRMEYLVKEKGLFNCETLEHDYETFGAAVSAVAAFEMGLSLKIVLQFNFFGGSIINLGSQRHRRLLPKVNDMSLIGCFAITELSHGSNVKAIQTVAHYDHDTKSFDVHTPKKEAMKWWIGNTKDAHMVCLFCQLYVRGVNHGIHVIIVPLRDLDTNEYLPGVIVGDCGPKVGLSGLDNGFIILNHVKVPRDNLLNRFGDVDDEGNYVSPIKNSNSRFGAMLAQLTMGRVGIVSNSALMLASALHVATVFSFERRQFGIGEEEVPVMTYQTQKLKIFPALSECIAYLIVSKYITKKYTNRTEETIPELHALSAGLKSYVSDRVAKLLIILREACGGHGYSALNRLGEWRDNQDATRTFEGDNTILNQAVSKYLLDHYQERYKATGFQSIVNYVGDTAHQYFRSGNLMGYSGSIADIDYICQLLDFRTTRLIHTGALRYRSMLEKLSKQHLENEDKKTRKMKDEFTAWNHVQSHFIIAAQSWIEHHIMSTFVDRVNACAEFDPNVHQILQRLCSLFGLLTIERDLAWFLLHKCIKEDMAKDVKRNIIRIVQSFSEADTRAILKSFPLAEWTIDAPIGQLEGTCNLNGEWSSVIYKNIYDKVLQTQCFGNNKASSH
jgi:acyl-CoA oxidase